MGLLEDVATFLEKYGIIGLAIALIIGLAVTDLVADIVLPVVAVFLPGGGWQNVTWTLALIEFRVGHFLSAFTYFLIIAFLIPVRQIRPPGGARGAGGRLRDGPSCTTYR